MRKNKLLFFAVPLMIILIGVIVYQYGYLGIRADLVSLKEEEGIKLRLLQKYMSLIAEKPVLEKQISSLKAERKADDSKLIEGQTPSIAAAALQDMVRKIVVENRGIIASERVGKPEEREKFQVITISMDLVMPDITALSNILYAIETRTPYLVVKELDTRVQNVSNPKDLTVKMDISGLTGGK